MARVRDKGNGHPWADGLIRGTDVTGLPAGAIREQKRAADGEDERENEKEDALARLYHNSI